MIRFKTPNQSSRGGERVRLIVIHGDAGNSDKGTVEWIMADESDVSYHYLIGRAGDVFWFVDEALAAWHAGESKWPGCTIERPGRKPTVNPSSIGVAFANNGKEPFRDEQYKAGAKLVASLCKQYGIGRDRVVGHNQVSPGRKTDPWPHFDWKRFHALMDAPPEPSPQADGDNGE